MYGKIYYRRTKKYLHFQRKTKLSMVAIFFRKKTSIRKAHFQFSFMPVGKKMANYATFVFSLPLRHFLAQLFYR